MTPITLPLLIALTSSTPAPAQEARDEALAKRIETYLAPLAEVGHLSGSLLVASGGEVVYEGSWGLANRELGVPNGTDTRYCIGGVSAHMTRVLTEVLLEEGTLAADDTLDQWAEDFPQGDKITVAHLRDYQAGIPQHIFEPEERTRTQTTADAVEAAKRAEFMFEPGTRSFYGFGSYCVLAYVLEQASGRTYGQLLREKVFGPVGMEHSAHVEGSELLPQRASCYRVGPDGFLNPNYEDVSYLTGSSSVWSTPRDLYRFNLAVLNGEYGETIKAQLALEKEFHWVGIFSCYRALVDHYPAGEDADVDLFVAFTSNVRTGAIDLLRTAMPRLVAGEDLGPAPVPTHAAVEVPAETLASLVGAYEIPGNELVMTLEGGRLFLGDWLLVPIGEDKFFSPMDYAEVGLARDEEGRIQGLLWTLGGRTLPCRKLR